jgi:hypothetical protein
MSNPADQMQTRKPAQSHDLDPAHSATAAVGNDRSKPLNGYDSSPKVANAQAGTVRADYFEPEQVARRSAKKGFEEQWNGLRDSSEPAKANDPFAGGHGVKAKIEDGKSEGQGGFGLRLLGASADQAQAKSGEWGSMAVPVVPSTEKLDTGMDEQACFVREHQASKGHIMSLGDDMPVVQREKEYANNWAAMNMQSIDRYKYEQYRFTGAYTSWMPMANASHTAMAELVECAQLMGFDGSKDKDAAGFVSGIEKALDMANDLVHAKTLGKNQSTSYAKRGDDATARPKVRPTLAGEQLTPKLSGIKSAYREIQAASNGVYLALLDDRKDALIAAKGEVTDEIEGINSVIEFWSGMGEKSQGAYQKSKNVADGSTAAKFDKPNNGDQEAGKHYDAAGKLALKGDDLASQSHAEKYLDHHESWGGGGEGVEVESGGMPELSAGGLIKAGLTMLNQHKLDELTHKLKALDSQAKSTTHTATMVKTKMAYTAALNAKDKFTAEMKKLGEQSVRDREQDMVQLGADLEEYASTYRPQLETLHQSHLAHGADMGTYSTMMACVAKVEKFRAVSRVATETFPFNDLVHTYRGMHNERNGRVRPKESAQFKRADAGHAPPEVPAMEGAEDEVYLQMTGTYQQVLTQDVHWGIRLAGVSSRFEKLMKAIAGDTKHDVGKKF